MSVQCSTYRVVYLWSHSVLGSSIDPQSEYILSQGLLHARAARVQEMEPLRVEIRGTYGVCIQG